MELKVFKDTIASYGGRWETRLELPVETEILIPDYLPAVFKIVKCLITPVVLQNRVSGGRWQSEGYLRCTVYYQSEETKRLHHVINWNNTVPKILDERFKKK